MDPTRSLKALTQDNKNLGKTLSELSERVERSMHLLSAISSLTGIPIQAADLQEGAETILETIVREVADVEGCSLLLFEPDEGVLKLLAARGQADLLGIKGGPYNKNLSFKPEEGVAGRVFSESRPMFWDREHPEEELLKTDPGLFTPQSLACLPIATHQETLGVLNISFGHSGPFDSIQKRDLILLSGVVANIIQTFVLRARLDVNTRELRNHRDRLEQLVQERTSRLENEIAEKEEAQQALAQSEERYRVLVERTSDGMFIADVDSFRFLFYNRNLADLFGWSETGDRSHTIWEMISSGDRRRFHRLLTQKIQSGRPEHLRERFEGIRKDGSEFSAEASISQVTFQGYPVIQGVIRDMSEQDRLRKRLEQAQRLEAIGTLAGGIAHDFNNILAAVMGYAQLLKKQVEPKPKVQANLDQILVASRRARDLVRQILTFSRQKENAPRPFVINPIVKEALRLLRATLPTTVQIEEQITDEYLAVMADPTNVHQVLMNLGANAGQAMPRGGVLEVRLEVEHILAQDVARTFQLPPGAYVGITFRDAGEGMSPEIQERIFEPYFTTRGEEGGTGLGLSVVHGIVKSHQGTILVSSQPGQGSEFKVLLPRADQGSPSGDPLPLSPPQGKEHVLLVEDEPALIDLYVQALEILGYRVTARKTGQEALETFLADPESFDLLLTDQTMPGMTGMDLAQRVMGIRPGMPVVLATGFSAQTTGKALAQAGIRACLKKPILEEELAWTLRKALDAQP